MRQVLKMSVSVRGQQLSEPLMGRVSERHRAAILASSLGAAPLSGKLTYIQQASLFNDLSNADCTEIARMACARRFLSTQLLFRAGDPASCVVFLASGRVKVSQVSHAGAHVVLAIVGGCNVVGGLGLEP